MAAEYYDLPSWKPAEVRDLKRLHAIELLHAIERNRDANLVQVLVHNDGPAEALVVDVCCDDVPNRNPYGLRSPERFAILIGINHSRPPTVFALRKDFPSVMHLNAAPPGTPRSLCLYFEPSRSVMRSWTAAKFLQRIQWWLARTARGTLHAADQPVELPFFDSGWELVIPADFDEIRQETDRRFVVSAVKPEHLDSSSTLRLHAHPGGTAKSDEFGFAMIDCPAIVHGHRHDIPETLGSLADVLNSQGIDLKQLLRAALHQELSEDGAPANSGGSRFVILLNIPICRVAGLAPEHTQRLALLTLVGRLELGIKLGAYSKLDGRVFKAVTFAGHAPEEGDWQAIQVLPAAVLNAPTPEALRSHSAVQAPGPSAAVLVGGGALGSELLDLWTRAGWGTWTVVDSDHIKPHNLARHAGFEVNIGQPKADVCAVLANAVCGANSVQHIVADACDTGSDALHQAIATAVLIVDCSTTLDFPRLASRNKYPGRHASLFLTPSGSGSVLLMEDKARTRTLGTLEPQYYRALLSNDWGANHLTGHRGTYWSGASCRDISYKLPHSSIVAHAGTLAEQIILRYEIPGASITVWHRDQSGAVSVFDIPTFDPVGRQCGSFAICLDKGLEAKLREMRAASLPNESGGILLGYHDFNLGEIVIVDALPPPPDSDCSVDHFDRGVEGLVVVFNEVQRQTANVVTYIGEWHSHPKYHTARQSQIDVLQLFRLAMGMADDGLPVLQLIVGEADIEIYLAEVET